MRTFRMLRTFSNRPGKCQFRFKVVLFLKQKFCPTCCEPINSNLSDYNQYNRITSTKQVAYNLFVHPNSQTIQNNGIWNVCYEVFTFSPVLSLWLPAARMWELNASSSCPFWPRFRSSDHSQRPLRKTANVRIRTWPAPGLWMERHWVAVCPGPGFFTFERTLLTLWDLMPSQERNSLALQSWSVRNGRSPVRWTAWVNVFK